MENFFHVFPSFRRKPKRKTLELMYVMMTKFLVYTLGDIEIDEAFGAIVSLVHDQCPFAPQMSRAFGQCLLDGTFTHPDTFSSLSPKSSVECTPLQCADFFSYINFRHALSILSGAKRSRPLEEMIAGGILGAA
jgi:hypothetical protein